MSCNPIDHQDPMVGERQRQPYSTGCIDTKPERRQPSPITPTHHDNLRDQKEPFLSAEEPTQEQHDVQTAPPSPTALSPSTPISECPVTPIPSTLLSPHSDPTGTPHTQATTPFTVSKEGDPSEYPKYLGTSVPDQPPLTWRPFTMHWAYLLMHVVLLSLALLALLRLDTYSLVHYGFSEKTFPPDSSSSQVIFRVVPVAIALCFRLAWSAIDDDFKRLIPFINMVNPVAARRAYGLRKNKYPGARGKDSLLSEYFPYTTYTMSYEWEILISGIVPIVILMAVVLLSSLAMPQTMYPPIPVNGTGDLHFLRLGDWQQQLSTAYSTDLVKKLAINDLSIFLNGTAEPARKQKPWIRNDWSVLPYALFDNASGSQRDRRHGETWEADTVVFHATLECESATSRTEEVDGSLLAIFQDKAGCSAQKMYPKPPSGQYLSFWNTTDSRTADESCQNKQLVAWGKASSPEGINWTAISCTPQYQIATITVRYDYYEGLLLPRKIAGALQPFTSNISDSVFPDVSTRFSFQAFTDFTRKAFFDPGIAAAGSLEGGQSEFLQGNPQLTRPVDLEALRNPENLAATAEASFAQVASRIFSIGLPAMDLTATDSLGTILVSPGRRFVPVKRWAFLPSLTRWVVASIIIAIIGAACLLLSVLIMEKYKVTGLKFDITAAGTSGTMLLLSQSGRVLDEDFKDLDQTTTRKELVKRLGERMYRLGYWEDWNRSVFWGIGREHGAKGFAKDVHSNKIERIPPDKVQEILHREGRPEVRFASIATILTITAVFAGLLTFIAITSHKKRGMPPIPDSNSILVISLFWVGIPNIITVSLFSVWWKFVDTHFRCTEPFVGLRTPAPAHKNITLDYRTVMMPLVPYKAAQNGHWKLFLVSSVTVLTTIMVGIAGTLFVISFPQLTVNVKFFPTHEWRQDGFATPKIEPYIYELISGVRESVSWSSWTDGVSVYLPVKTDGRTVVGHNITEPLWTFDTQYLRANLTDCRLLNASNLIFHFTDIDFGGRPGRVVDSISLNTTTCVPRIAGICGRSENTTAIPSGVCSAWTLLGSPCLSEGKWWIYWQTGKGLGYDKEGWPVFAADTPPLVNSLLCDTSIWQSDVTVTMNSESKIISRDDVSLKSTTLRDGGSTNGYRKTFNSLLHDTLNATRAANDSTDLMAFLMQELMPNPTQLLIPENLHLIATAAYSALFTTYTRSEEILWSALSEAEMNRRTTAGTISGYVIRILIRPASFSLYVVCVFIFIFTMAFVQSSLRERRLPRSVISIADVVTYFYRSPGILDDFKEMHDVKSEKELVERVGQKNRLYVLGEGTGRDGVSFVGIGDPGVREMNYEAPGLRRRTRWLSSLLGRVPRRGAA